MTAKKNSSKKVMVFGANGYLGRHLVYYLLQQGFEVFPIGNSKVSIDNLANYRSIDVKDKTALSTLDWEQDFVFVFSGKTGTMASVDNYEDFIGVNETGLLNILNCIKNLKNKPRVIFPSTRLVYKGSEKPLKESDEKEAKTIYAVNKIACESILEIYKNLYDIKYSVFRVCVPYGSKIKDGYSYGTIGFFLREAKQQKPIKLYGDGNLRRTFSHVEDICGQIILSLESNSAENQTYNIAGETFSLLQVATLIAQKYGSEVSFAEWPENDLKIESGHTEFDDSKIMNEFGFILKNKFQNWLDESGN